MKSIKKSVFLFVSLGMLFALSLLMLGSATNFAQAQDHIDSGHFSDAADTLNAASLSSIIDYEFDEVPAERVILMADVAAQVQPRQSFNLSYALEPFWTTTSKVFYDVYPENAASVSDNGTVTVSAEIVAGSNFSIVATADDSGYTESEPLEFLVVGIPVTDLTLAPDGVDSLLLIGKSRGVVPTIQPTFASDKRIRYEISGTGLEYVKSFDTETGVVIAKEDIEVLNAGATVVITAYSIDNETCFDSVVYTLHLASVRVELSAETPLNVFNASGNPLAVSSSIYSDTVTLKTLVNNSEVTGLNYVILSGQTYVQNGYILPNGTFKLRTGIAEPHAEVKIMVAYSDGYDEITVSVYVPIEEIRFNNVVPDMVENFREYNLKAQAYPSYATYLADNAVPINYSLNGLSAGIATVGLTNGLLTLPRSTTSYGSTINFTAYLPNAWNGVDAAPLNHSLYISPVYAEDFDSTVILKNGNPIDAATNKVLPDDNLCVEVVYDKDNVTHLAFILSENSAMLSTVGSGIVISSLSAMESDNPNITITITYNNGGNNFSTTSEVWIYVPAEYATLDGSMLDRDAGKDLNSGLIINGHNYANNHSIIWGNVSVETVDGQTGIAADVSNNGILSITSKAHAGTKVTVQYRTYDGVWDYKTYEVAPLSGIFTLSYSKDREYSIDVNAPQLEQGQSIDLILQYNGVGAFTRFGVTYTITITSNATLYEGSKYTNRDLFSLTAKGGESGRNNYINYLITISDGTSTYCVRTPGMQPPYGVTTDCVTKEIAIFKRATTGVNVHNSSVVVGSIFGITGWNSEVTFDPENLSWSISGGTLNSEHKILTAPNSGFVLTISCSQSYNGSGIPWSAEITFIGVMYRNDDGSIRDRSYFKTGERISIGSSTASKAGYTHTGWATSAYGSKQYELSGSQYGGTSDLNLYPYWTGITYYVEFYYLRNDDKTIAVSFKDGSSGATLVARTYGQTYQVKEYEVSGGTFNRWEINGVTFSKDLFPYYSNLTTAPGTTVRMMGYVDWSCVASGTLITLADGTQKPVELLTGSEQLLVWNMVNGNFDSAPILFMDTHGMKTYNIIKLGFSDGTGLDIIQDHYLWSIDLNKYVHLDKNASNYLGHWFNKQTVDNNGNLTWIKVQLTSVTIKTERTAAWSPVTFGHLCYYVNGLLSMPANTEAFINIYNVNPDTMQIDATQYAADVEKFGLYTYDAFIDDLHEFINANISPMSRRTVVNMVPELFYEAMGGENLKVAFGKNNLTWTELYNLIAGYSKFLTAKVID